VGRVALPEPQLDLGVDPRRGKGGKGNDRKEGGMRKEGMGERREGKGGGEGRNPVLCMTCPCNANFGSLVV